MISADALIWLGYMLIPLVGLWFLRRRPELSPDRRLARLSLLFVFFCGLTHIVHSIMFWWPAYHVLLVVKLLTLLATWAFVVRLWVIRHLLLDFAPPSEARSLRSGRDRASAVRADIESRLASSEATTDTLVADVRSILDRLEHQEVTG